MQILKLKGKKKRKVKVVFVLAVYHPHCMLISCGFITYPVFFLKFLTFDIRIYSRDAFVGSRTVGKKLPEVI